MTSDHSHACTVCGRSWPCAGDCSSVEFQRCLTCGATVDDRDRSPDGIFVKPHDAAEKEADR